jgi:hypothetical protein
VREGPEPAVGREPPEVRPQREQDGHRQREPAIGPEAAGGDPHEPRRERADAARYEDVIGSRPEHCDEGREEERGCRRIDHERFLAEPRDLEERRRVHEVQPSVEQCIGEQDVLVVRVVVSARDRVDREGDCAHAQHLRPRTVRDVPPRHRQNVHRPTA